MDEDKITEDEWLEVFDCLPKNLLKLFNIENIQNLQDFISEHNYKNVDEIWLKYKSMKFYDFFSFVLPKLKCDLAQEFILKFLENDPSNAVFYFQTTEIATFPLGKEIFMKLASLFPDECFSSFDKYKTFSDGTTNNWAYEIIVEAAYFLNKNNLNKEQIKNFPEIIKIKIERNIIKKERNEILAELLISKNLDNNDKEKDLKINKLLKDPALRNISDVNSNWIKPLFQNREAYLKKEYQDLLKKLLPNGEEDTLGLTEIARKRTLDKIPLEIVNCQAMIARNLYFQGQDISEQNVRNEVKRIMETRETYRNITLFAGKNVTLAAHLEKKESDQFGDLNRFGKQALVDRIKKDGGNIDGVLRPEDSLESLKETKQKILDAVKNTKPPFTFVFQGHGSEHALYLSDGQTKGIGDANKIKETERTVKITTDDLFQAYKIRQQKFGNKTQTPEIRDIFIDGGCFNSNFIRNFYLLCEKEGIQKPIFAGESEYGQYGYSEYDSEYGDNFFDHLFDSSDTKTAVLGNIIDNDMVNRNSNPSFYIPDDQNKTMQLSESKNLENLEKNIV